MNPLKTPKKDKEAQIQDRIIKKLTLKGWYVKSTHGNAYQKGLPDLYACCQGFGFRWIEVKQPVKYKFTKAQLTVFPAFAKRNCGIWILNDDAEYEYDKLFYPPNWHTYLYKSNGIVVGEKLDLIPKSGPEAEIQFALIDKLQELGWFCVETYGSLYQSGLPDLFICHKEYGSRWVECKNPLRYSFTPAQSRVFPRFHCEGVGIWILTSVDEISKLAKPPNWQEYLK